MWDGLTFDDVVKDGDGLLVSISLPDPDVVFGGGGDPLEIRVEGDLVDGGSSVVLVQGFLQVGDVPVVQLLVLSSGDDVPAVGGDGHGVDVVVVCLELVPDGVVQVPDLEPAVPSDADEVWVDTGRLALVDRRESDLADPLGVVVLLAGVFAVSQGVEQLQLLLGSR